MSGCIRDEGLQNGKGSGEAKGFPTTKISTRFFDVCSLHGGAGMLSSTEPLQYAAAHHPLAFGKGRLCRWAMQRSTERRLMWSGWKGAEWVCQ
jgi:hypothetical protein